MSTYVPSAPPIPDQYRLEVGPLADNISIKKQLNTWASEGWRLVSLVVVPVGQPHPQNPSQMMQMPAFMFVLERIARKNADPATERLAVPVLETLVSQVKNAMPFMGLSGIMRDKLDGAVQSSEAFLQGQPA